MGPGIQFKALALHARGPAFNFKFKEKKMEVFHVKVRNILIICQLPSFKTYNRHQKKWCQVDIGFMAFKKCRSNRPNTSFSLTMSPFTLCIIHLLYKVLCYQFTK